ncbi:uncharacterized protein LOC123484442 [Coregonus clupeaformis]|uniref:uncharacterized protein LOC123484442 n=1 Tax=Coregonus clupeaformis TaxID=59861 RepID=UPI001E1C97A0|nr:uncharacterized protein LOC123484442 [Coregonus clupeaformis]
MLLRVQLGEEQKYVKLSELTFNAFLKEVCLKFNIPESRKPDIKVYDQSDTEVDSDVFEELVKESPGTFRIMLGNGLDTSHSSSCSGTSDDTIILNFTVCDDVEEVAAGEGSQPKRPCHINYEAKALIEKILTSKPGGERIMQEYGKTKSLTDATRRQMINILAAEMTETHGTSPQKCQSTGDTRLAVLSMSPPTAAWFGLSPPGLAVLSMSPPTAAWFGLSPPGRPLNESPHCCLVWPQPAWPSSQ